MATFTRHPREIVVIGIDFEWTNLWSYNAFRMYEVVFGRKAGLRHESRTAYTYIDGELIVSYHFATWESLVTHSEKMVRDYFKTWKFDFRWVSLPQLAIIGGVPLSTTYRFSIAFVVVDHNNDNTATVSTVTITHSPAGSNIADVVFGIFNSVSDLGMTATDNAVSMPVLDKIALGTARWVYTFFLNPTTSGNIVVHTGSNAALAGVVMSYSGNVGGLDNHTIVNGSAATTFSTTIVTSTANEFVVAAGISDNALVSGTWGQTTRFSDGFFLNGNFGDLSFASAGTQTVSFSQSPGQVWTIQAVSLKPTTALIHSLSSTGAGV